MPAIRELTDAERDALLERASRAWEIDSDHWYPLTTISREDVVAFRAGAFREQEGAARLRAALRSIGVARLVETREFIELPARESDLGEVDFEYDGAEGYWCDGSVEWLVYASHEDTITVGGAALIEALQHELPQWESMRWTGW